MCGLTNRRASKDANYKFFQTHQSTPTDLVRRAAKALAKEGKVVEAQHVVASGPKAQGRSFH